MAKTIVMGNFKGGVGKTTLTHHLATGLHMLTEEEERSNPRVLLIDADAQCNLSISCLTGERFEELVFTQDQSILTLKELIETFLEDAEAPVHVEDYILKNAVRKSEGEVFAAVDLLPSHPDLIYTDMNIAVYSRPNFRTNLMGTDIYKFQILNNIINRVKAYYDFIFIDCPPNLNFITQNALYTSTHYLIPTIPDTLSSYGISSIKSKVDDLNETFQRSSDHYKNTNLIGIIPNQIKEYRGRPIDTQARILANLKAAFPDKVFKHYLTNGDGITRASANGYPVFAYESSGNGKKQSDFIKEILREFLMKSSGDGSR